MAADAHPGLWVSVERNVGIIRTNHPYDRYSLGTRFYLPGLANSANFVGFCEGRRFQARIVVNWTGEQYGITSHVDLFFKALNLSNSEIVEHGRFDNQILNVQDFGRTFTMGIRATL